MTLANLESITTHMQDLRLKHASLALRRDVESMQENERNSVLKHLTKWLELEKAERQTQLIASRIKSAKFTKVQTVDTFSFAHSPATQRIEKTYLALLQSIAKDSLPSAIFAGTAGLGKTHLARALGYRACQQGLSVAFLTAAKMVNHLSHAQKIFSLETELAKYRRPHVLIIDELGYVTLDAQASNLFFQVISARHDLELGTIATTNIPFGKFNQIFANDAIAHAIVDRLVNDAEVFFLEGESYRPHQRQEKLKKKKG